MIFSEELSRARSVPMGLISAASESPRFFEAVSLPRLHAGLRVEVIENLQA